MQTSRSSMRTLATAFLAVAACTLILWSLSYDRAVLVMQYYTGPMALVFLGLNLQRGVYGRRSPYLLGITFVLWFVISRVLNGELYLQNSWWHLSSLCVTYLLAFPFAFATDDGQRRRGLTVVAWLFSIAFSLLAWLSVIAIVRGQNIVLPFLGSELGAESSRLTANQHPNGSAMLFLIAFVFSLYLAAHLRKRWVLFPAALMCLGCYLGIALTVSRTVMVELSLVMGAVAFLGCMRLKKLRRAALRFVCAAAAFVLAFGLCYASFDFAVRGVTAVQQKQLLPTAAAQQQEPTPTPVPENVIKTRPMGKDLATLTGRSSIWNGAMSVIRNDPKVALIGILDSEYVPRINEFMVFKVTHVHNAWLQTLLNLGLPALLMALCFTFLALRAGIRMLLIHKVRWEDQLLALMPLLFLVNSLTECVLFVEMFSYANFAVFLSLGYLLEREKTLPKKA